MAERELYFSFFMFTVDLRPGDRPYAQTIVRHIEALSELGYAGFDLPIAADRRRSTTAAEVERYAELKRALDAAGVGDVPASRPTWAPRGRSTPRRRTRSSARTRSRT